MILNQKSESEMGLVNTYDEFDLVYMVHTKTQLKKIKGKKTTKIIK